MHIMTETISLQSGPTTRRAFTIAEAAAFCGVSYHTLYRAACRGDLRVLTGFGRMMVSDKELDRFLGKTEEYRPIRRKKLAAEVVSAV